jgi:hypothetical protein
MDVLLALPVGECQRRKYGVGRGSVKATPHGNFQVAGRDACLRRDGPIASATGLL